MSISEYNKKLYEKIFFNGNNKLYYRAHELKIQKIIQLIDGSPKKILDLGCADGWFGKLLKDKFNAKVYGTDIGEKMLKIAENRGLIIKKFDLSVNKWPYESDFFDLIIAGDIIEHIYDTENFVSECKRVLKTNGQLIISTPNINAYHNRFLVIFGKMPFFFDFAPNISMYNFLPPMGHIRVFNKYSLIKLIKKFDLKIEKIYGANLHVDKNIFPKKFQLFLGFVNKLEWFFSRFPTLAPLLIIKSRKIN